jgi:3-oxoacyl-[acyl-carrier protein] reductase
MDLYLNQKTAVVTGASQGLGRAITQTLAAEGVKVLAIARNEALLKSLQEEIATGGGVTPEIMIQDFLAPDAPQRIATTAKAALRHIDILINNAGRSRPLDIVGPDEEWQQALLLDFDRHRQLTQHLLPQMIERRQGSILNVTSTYELRSINASAVFKASITVWAKQLAAQLGPHGITVNCLQPGLIDTANIRRVFTDEQRQAYAPGAIPLGDFGTPQDVANMATFLVSPRARYITGTVSTVDGGWRQYAF